MPTPGSSGWPTPSSSPGRCPTVSSLALRRGLVLVLASIPLWYWEEQFGMVLAEAMAAHLPIVASTCGAIPEVVGSDARLFAPGDWVGLANALAAGPLARTPGDRYAPAPERIERFSSASAAGRLRTAYQRLAPV